MVLVLLTSLNCCMSTLRLVHYALLLTPACWRSNNTKARLMALAPSLALDPTFGIHSHKTLDTAQPCHLLKPNWKPSSSQSISILTNLSTQFLLQSVYACVCVCVCACVCKTTNKIWKNKTLRLQASTKNKIISKEEEKTYIYMIINKWRNWK